MNKLSVFLLALALSCTGNGVAHAINFKARGVWLASFQLGQHGNFTRGGHAGYDHLEDEFEARSRVRLQIDAVASEALSGQVYFEIGKLMWGKAANPQGGGALGADASIVKLKRAFIDWRVPETALRLRMGIQAVRSPYAALDGPTVMTGDAAAVTASWKPADNVDVTAYWMRPYNDNYEASDGDGSCFMDNMDVFGLSVPVRLDGVRVTPWAMYGAIGPNTFRSASGYNANRINGVDGKYFFSGMFPVLCTADGIARGKSLSSYANAWWVGLAGDVTAFDPLRMAWEFSWGGISWPDDSSLNRQGWMAALLLEYRLGWCVPGLYGWYTSGDDDDLGNGSERMPYIVNDFGVSSFSSTFAGPAENGLERDRVIGNTLIGTWGVGARLKDMRFLEDLAHTFHVSLFGGTNDHRILKRIHDRTGSWMTPNTHSTTPAIGRENLYMTDRDYALEIGLANRITVYENLQVNVDAAYIRLFLDDSDDTWGQALTGGDRRDLRDAWNVSVLFIYSF